jgi:hypothetical protein
MLYGLFQVQMSVAAVLRRDYRIRTLLSRKLSRLAAPTCCNQNVVSVDSL